MCNHLSQQSRNVWVGVGQHDPRNPRAAHFGLVVQVPVESAGSKAGDIEDEFDPEVGDEREPEVDVDIVELPIENPLRVAIQYSS